MDRSFFSGGSGFSAYVPGRYAAAVPLSLLLLVLFSGLASAAESPEPLYEIEVTSPRTLMHLRQEVAQAEDAVHAIWNDLNDDESYDIVCVWEAPTGSTIKRKQCSPRYVGELTQEHASEFLAQTAFASDTGGTIALDDTNVMVQYHTSIYQQKMRDMIEENPEFLEAVIHHSALLERLKSAQQALRDD